MSVSFELQKHITTLLKADAAVMEQINDIYDDVPEEPFGETNAYISFGSTDYVEDDADGETGDERIRAGEHTIQIDVWTRNGGGAKCKRVCDAVKIVLHENEEELEVNALVEMRVVLFQVVRDPDGLTHHGIIQVTAKIEETT